MQSAFLKLNSRDFINGLVVAVLTPVLALILKWMGMEGFDFLTADWSSLVLVALTAGGGYLAKNLFTAENGAFMGVIGGR